MVTKLACPGWPSSIAVDNRDPRQQEGHKQQRAIKNDWRTTAFQKFFSSALPFGSKLCQRSVGWLSISLGTMFCSKIEGRSQIVKCCKFLNYLEFFFCRNILISFAFSLSSRLDTIHSIQSKTRIRTQQPVQVDEPSLVSSSTLIMLVVQCIHSLSRLL